MQDVQRRRDVDVGTKDCGRVPGEQTPHQVGLRRPCPGHAYRKKFPPHKRWTLRTNEDAESPRKTVPTDIRERLLMAAVALVREQGLPKLTQPRLAKAAGVSQSHLTYYFPTRADLLHAVLERAAERQRAGVQATVAAAEKGVATLVRQLAQQAVAPRKYARPRFLRARS